MSTGSGPCATSRTRELRPGHGSNRWMTTIVDLDTGQVLGVVDGRDHKGVGDWLFARPLEWRLSVQVVAIDPSAAFRKALRMWLPRTAVAVDHFHLISLANQAMTETRQNLSQQVKGRRGRAIDKAWAHRMLLLRSGDTLSCRTALRLEEIFTLDDPTGILQAVWKVKEQLRSLLRTGSLEDAAEAKTVLEELVKAAARPETNRLYRTVCRWWKEIEVLIITGATTGKVEANNTAIKNIKRTARGYRNAANYKSVIPLEKCRPDGGMTLIPGIDFPMNREEPSEALFGVEGIHVSTVTVNTKALVLRGKPGKTSRAARTAVSSRSAMAGGSSASTTFPVSAARCACSGPSDSGVARTRTVPEPRSPRNTRGQGPGRNSPPVQWLGPSTRWPGSTPQSRPWPTSSTSPGTPSGTPSRQRPPNAS